MVLPQAVPAGLGPFDAVASRYGLKCQNADHDCTDQNGCLKFHERDSCDHRLQTVTVL